MEIVCQDSNGTTFERRPDITGLVRLTLSPDGNCSIQKDQHKWRADLYLSTHADVRINTISLGLVHLFESIFDELKQNKKIIHLPQYPPVTLDMMLNDLHQISFKQPANWGLVTVVMVARIMRGMS